MSTRLRMCAVFLFLASTVASAQEWVEVKSPHFSVYTDAGEKRGREVAERFEQMRAAFGLLFQRMRVNIPVPLQIIAFRRSGELRDFAPLWKGKPVSLDGFFQSGEDRNFIAIDLSSHDWSVVFHEYAHLLINGNVPPTPAWYDEGFAEYCSTLVIANKRIEFGHMPEQRYQALASSAWMRVQDLFSVSHSSKEYNEGDRRSVFYAQSTLIVNYLMGTEEGRKQLVTYLYLTQEKHVPVAEAIPQAFGMAPRTLDDALRTYYRDARFRYLFIPAPADFAAGPFQSRKLDELEWQTVLADLRFHSRDHRGEGVAEFRRILEKQPDNPAANRGLGYVYLLQNDFDRAAQHFSVAARDSQDPRIHYLNAMLASRRVLGSSVSSDELAGVRSELKTAIALDPNYADAYNLLAFAEAASGKVDEAVATMRKATELDPRNQMYQANLARYEMAAQHWDAAEKIWKTLLDSDNAEIAHDASNNLSEIAAQRSRTASNVATSLQTRADASAPPLQSKVDNTAEPAERPVNPPPPQQQTIRFVKGKLLAVDCSATPGAVLSVSASGKNLVMFTNDVRKLLLIGEDNFSCDWKDRKVSVNYRLKPDGRGEIVSLELD